MRMRINALENNAAEILLYDIIGGYDENTGEVMNAKNFINQIKNFNTASLIKLRINSAGGQVFDAIAIYNYLISLNAEIYVYIDGIAASAASLIAMAGDKIFMPKNALIMIHNPSSIAQGNSDELKEAADSLDKVRSSMIEIYKSKTGLDAEKLLDMLNAETYLNAEEAFKLKFCTDIIDSQDITACLGQDGALRIKAQNIFAELSPEFVKAVSDKKLFNIEPKAATPEPELKTEAEGEAERNDFILGVEDERRRLKELDDLLAYAPGCEALINQAKYESFKSAGEIALEVLKSVRGLNAVKQDAKELDNALAPVVNVSKQERDEQALNLLINNINNLRGEC